MFAQQNFPSQHGGMPGGYPQQQFPQQHPSQMYPQGSFPDGNVQQQFPHPQFQQGGYPGMQQPMQFQQGGYPGMQQPMQQPPFPQQHGPHPAMGFEAPGMMFDPKAPISFQPPYIRSQFVQKVYAILSVQLLITAVIAVYISSKSLLWIHQHFMFAQLASLLTMMTMVGVMCCCHQVAREFPTNYLFLLLITVGIGTSTGFVASLYTAKSVLLALVVTCAVFFALTAFACLTGYDFTGMGPYLMAALIALITFGFTMWCYTLLTHQPVDSMMHLVYAVCGVILFSLYIVYDTQLIVGGEHKAFQFSVDDYVFAALNIYLDIINLFLMILRIMGERR